MQPDKQHHQEKQQKHYLISKKKWKDFKIDEAIIQALNQYGKNKPTRVQSDSLQISTNTDRKKFNLLIKAINGSGKTFTFLIPMINALEKGCAIAEDKVFKGKNMPNQIFRPQGVIFVQTNLLQGQIEQQLQKFVDYGEKQNLDKLKFKIGYLHKDKHEPGDIIVCMPTSFLNRHKRGNMKLDQCKFVGIDEVDDIFQQSRDDLAKVLEIFNEAPSHVITCSATMKGNFMKFYNEACPNHIKINVNETIEKQSGQKITLQGVSNYFKTFKQGKIAMHKFIVHQIFKQLYSNTDRVKPQVFIFFNSIDQIEQFDKYFQTIASDFTNDESAYLGDIKRDTIAARRFKDGKKTDLTVDQKKQIMSKFRNNETNILLATNIIARGIDVRNACFVINVGGVKKKEKDQHIDVDTYLHRVGRTGRHNDKGVALTLITPDQQKPLVEGVQRFHKLKISQIPSPKQIADEVFQCIKNNAN